MAANRTFFHRVRDEGKMTLRDIFSDVTRKHSREQTARVFIAGTELTTPKPADMLSGWQKPFLFARMFLGGLITIALLWILTFQLNYTPGIFLMYILISVIVDLSLMLMIWEMHIPRNISLMDVLGIIMMGGALSLVATIIFGQFMDTAPVWAGLIEEPAKLVVICLVLRRRDYRYQLDGILIGFAVGTGFAIMENLIYTFSAAFSSGLASGLWQAIVRALTAISGHGIYAALYGGALVRAKGREKLQLRHFGDRNFLVALLLAILLHAFNNLGIDLGLPSFLYGLIDLQWVLVTVVAVAVFLPFLRRGVNEIVTIAAKLNGGITRAVHLQGNAPAGRSGLSLEGVGQAVGYNRISYGEPITIGRSKGDLQVPQATNVSGSHCRIEYSGDRVYVIDLNSTNGTWLGEQKLIPGQKMPINDGDVIYLGSKNCGFRVHK